MNITIPHKFTPRDYQLPFLKAMDSGIKRAVLCWHRRSGKDKTAWNYMIKQAIVEKGNYYYFLPTAALAKQVIWDNIDNDGFKTIEHCPQEAIKNINSTEMVIELVNGSTIKLIGSDKFEKRAIGTNPRGVVFSEYSVTEPQVWNFVRPILAANDKAWAVFIFTPRGTNHGWKILQQGKDNPKWFTQTLSVDDTHAISEEAIAEEKLQMPADLVQQEYYCEFLEGAGAFFKRVDGNCLSEGEKFDPTHKYQMGVDLAKYQDYTVISVFDMMTFEQVYMDRFNQIDYNLQKAKIEAVYLRYGKPLTYIDSTGLGEPIYDDLVSKGLNVEPFRFTQKTREDLLRNLQMLIEQDRIKPFNNEILKDELKSFQYVLSGQGRLKIAVPDGMHDDTVFSLALSAWELPSAPRREKLAESARFLTRAVREDGTNQTSYE